MYVKQCVSTSTCALPLQAAMKSRKYPVYHNYVFFSWMTMLLPFSWWSLELGQILHRKTIIIWIINSQLWYETNYVRNHKYLTRKRYTQDVRIICVHSQHWDTTLYLPWFHMLVIIYDHKLMVIDELQRSIHHIIRCAIQTITSIFSITATRFSLQRGSHSNSHMEYHTIYFLHFLLLK